MSMSDHLLAPYRDVIVKLVTEQAMGALLVSAPFLSLPVVNTVVKFMVSKFVGVLLDATILGLNMAYVATETAIDLHNFKKALEEYKYLMEKGEGQDKLDEKEKEIIKHGFDLIDLNGKRL